jgi:galactose mutarotase-like enzyme
VKWVALLLTLWLAGAVAETQAFENEKFITLDNGNGIRAVVAPDQGGELSSLSIRFDDQWFELLYRAGDYSTQSGWRGKAPLLWPATGISFLPGTGSHHYLLNGEQYPMPFHGFAMRQPWDVISQSSPDGMAALALKMSSTAKTRKYYPFGFELMVRYQLHGDRLHMEYAVTADGDNNAAMPFSIGNHITFNAPLMPGSDPEDLRFYNQLPDMLLRDSNKVFTGEVVPAPFIGWHSIAALGERQAVSLGGRSGAAELLLLDPSGLQLRLVHSASSEPSEPTIRFNLWADTKNGFFSPEPWLGTQNSLNSGLGLITLSPGETWTWRIDIIPSRVQPGEIADGDSK